MPQPSLISTVQKLEIDNVGSITLTEIAVDLNGKQVRELRVFGIPDADNPAAPQVFTLRLSADAAAKITLATPVLSF